MTDTRPAATPNPYRFDEVLGADRKCPNCGALPEASWLEQQGFSDPGPNTLFAHWEYPGCIGYSFDRQTEVYICEQVITDTGDTIGGSNEDSAIERLVRKVTAAMPAQVTVETEFEEDHNTAVFRFTVTPAPIDPRPSEQQVAEVIRRALNIAPVEYGAPQQLAVRDVDELALTIVQSTAELPVPEQAPEEAAK